MIARRVGGAGLALAAILAASFAVAAPPERCPSVDVAELRRSAQATVDWFVRNQERDGTWLYLYDAGEDSVSADYNWVRHAGVTMGLYQAAEAGLPGALRSADRGTAWALERLFERDDIAALAPPGAIPAGASALWVAGLAIRREATGDTRHDDLMRRLGRFLVGQIERSGAVLASYSPTRGAPVPGEYSKYYTGEAYWALALLDEAFPGEKWGEAAARVGDYLASSRDEAEDHWPPIPDHWAAYGVAETIERPGGRPLSDGQVDYARRQAELFGAQARWVSQRFGPWGGLVRGTYTPRGGGYGVIGEALTGWWLAARAEPRLADLREPLADRAACVAGLAIEAQSDAEDAEGAARPERLEGAWYLDGETRMDDQQHALAALLRTVPIVEAGEGSGAAGPGGDPPSAWLWIAVLVLALNPPRAAFAIPRAGRPDGDAVRVAAAGGALGGLAVLASAALGDPLLEVVNVSDPSFRTAAGIVAVVAGIADLFRRPPAPEPALPGRRAALVPVAIPVVARPALLVLALSAGADRGVLVSLAAIFGGVVLLVALTAASDTAGPPGRGLRWAGRVMAAGLLAGGVLLTVDGILDV